MAHKTQKHILLHHGVRTKNTTTAKMWSYTYRR